MSLSVLAEGLTFPEGPRWHQGQLVFADFYSHWVHTVDLAGHCRRVVEVPGQPSGIGWLPGGDMLVVSMRDRQVLRWDGRSLGRHADLSALAHGHANDMIVLPSGRAYVGNFGFDPHSEAPRTTCLIRVEPDGSTHIAAQDLAFPNGMALLACETQLLVAQSVAQCLTLFDMHADGTLHNRRLFARTDGCQPDGICVDHDGSVLVTTMTCNRLLRFSATGALLATAQFDTPLWACAVTDQSEILLCTAEHFVAEECLRYRSGKIRKLGRDHSFITGTGV